MNFVHNANIPYGFGVQMETEGFTGGDGSETFITIRPEDGCQFEVVDYLNNILYAAEKENPVRLVFRGDCELSSLISNLQFLLEILNAYEEEGRCSR